MLELLSSSLSNILVLLGPDPRRGMGSTACMPISRAEILVVSIIEPQVFFLCPDTWIGVTYLTKHFSCQVLVSLFSAT